MLFDPLGQLPDLRRLAETQARFAGRIALATPRLAELVAETPTDVWLRLAFDWGPRHLPRLRGEVRTEVRCVCQRCQELFQCVLESSWELILAQSEEEAHSLDEEGLDGHYTKGALDMAAVIEDELMLALPMAPRHEPPCVAATQTAGEPHPFAALKGLFAPDGHDK